MMRRILLQAMAVLGIALLLPAPADARVIHKERSVYSTILVTEERQQRCLQFSVRRNQRNQSCMDLRHPRHMVFPYTRMMMASLLFNPAPQRILVVGLGGGTLPMALVELLPNAQVVAVEIDPAVVRVAETHFGFKTSERLEVVVQDARVYTKRAALRGAAFDLIMLDAYNGDYIPEHLLTREYLQETQALLAPGGVLAANTFAISDLYDHESTTYQAVFGAFFNLRLPDTGNRVILATSGEPADTATRKRRAEAWRQALAPYDVDLTEYLDRISTKPDWDENARVLTDQYSPANLLNHR